jgi:hypothetical protein
MNVYLSSTLNDLEAERRAVKDVLGGECVVKESYKANEGDLVESCLEDVGACELYIGILGLRYGFVPPGQELSITHLEYEQAKAKGLQRLVFLKDESAISVTASDYKLKEHPVEKIEGFRKQVSSGKPGEARPATFKGIDDLKVAVLKAYSDYRARKTGSAPIMVGVGPHPWAVRYEASIAYVPGTDDGLKQALESGARGDRRIRIFPLSLAKYAEADYFATLDREVRQARLVLLAVSSHSLPRLREREAVVSSALATVASRCPNLSSLLVGVKPADLPPSVAHLLADSFESQSAEWEAATRDDTFERLQQWRRERVPETTVSSEIGIPYLVIALTAQEADALGDGSGAIFDSFGVLAKARRDEFQDLRKRLCDTGLDWPAQFYTGRRDEWRPFGAEWPNTDEFVRQAARKVNLAPEGSRERGLLLGAHLIPQRYAFEEYLTTASGSRENLRRVCDTGCLVLVDEFALLHPGLRSQIDGLLGSNNAAVVSLSACDPAHRALRHLLTDDTSYLRVGTLLARFRDSEDVRCELAVNSVERLQRWLRFVLPELMATLGQQKSDPNLVGKVDNLLASRPPGRR